MGDPSDRLTSRDVQSSSLRKENMVRMHVQLRKLWANAERHAQKHGYHWQWPWRRELANNFVWMNKLTVLEFLQVLGAGVRVGPMLGRET